MEYLKSLLATIRKINLTAIGKNALTGFGWLGRTVGGFFMGMLEAVVDAQIKKGEQAIDTKVSDNKIDEEAKQDVEQINQATTDDEFDAAARKSLD